MFQANQQVECVVPANWRDCYGTPVDGPKARDVLTVLEVVNSSADGREGLVFVGCNVRSPTTGEVMAYESKYFRPLTKKGTETGMAILRKIAETGKLPSRKKVDA